MSLAASVRNRVDPVPLTALLAVGDLVCIAVFVFGGAAGGHGFDPVGQFGRVAQTYLTFLIGWVVAAFAAGLYATETRRRPRDAFARTAGAWVAAAVLAQGLRATPVFPGNAAMAFFLVSVGVGLALVGSWRVAATRLAGR